MKSFGVSKFKSLLLAGSFTVLANYFIRLSDSVVAGNLLGAEALAGINMVAPLLAAVSFVSGLISTGMATHYSQEMGRCDRNRARQYFMQALWMVLAVGGGMSVLIYFGKNAYLSFMGASTEISSHAGSYMSWQWATVVPECLMGLVIMLGYADGDTRLCSLSYVANFTVNLVVSFVSVRFFDMGAAGCAMATLVAEVAGLAVLSVHFFGKTNTFVPVSHFSLADGWGIIKASFGDAAAFLCDGVLFFVVSKFVIANYGSTYLPVLGVVTSLWGFLEFFNGVGVAVQPIVTVYYGEGNSKSARDVMRSAMKVSLIEGLLVMVALNLFPQMAISLVGIRDPELVCLSVTAVRCMSIGFVALSFAGLFNSYYMFVDRPGLAGLVTFLGYAIMPIASMMLCSAMVGINGVWLGIGLGPLVGIVMVSLGLLKAVGRDGFPLMLPHDRESDLHVFDLRLEDREIVEVSRRIGEIPGVPMRASLMVEEVFMTVKERNAGRKVLGEATLDMRDGVQLTLRDDGVIFDITDTDQQISSLRTFLVASVMERQNGRLNLVTTGFNRNVFRF